MRIVFDTNTLISALLFKGQTAYLVDVWKTEK
jgi:predicted nucleic acid-binding protein